MNALTTQIDVHAIAHNTRLLKQRAGDALLMCVVKADAYNHGVARCVPVMDANGADAFGVATLAEAKEVAQLTTKPVLAWLWTLQEVREGVDRFGGTIEFGVPSLSHLRLLIDVPSARTAYLMVDTGLHRSGLDEADWAEAFALAARAQREGRLHVKGLMSHLACADDPGDPWTQVQGQAFARAVALAREAGLAVPCNHLVNSPGTWSRKALHWEQVRPGLSLYGLEPIPGEDHQLRPAMRWVGEVVVVKALAKGEPVSYSGTWRAPADGFSAVVPAGYADGVMRSWQGNLSVTIDGVEYQQVGRVCMDQIVIWLGANERGVRAGDEAVLFGVGGISASEFARRVGTIDYEVLCAPKGRTRRVYVEATAPDGVKEGGSDAR